MTAGRWKQVSGLAAVALILLALAACSPGGETSGEMSSETPGLQPSTPIGETAVPPTSKPAADQSPEGIWHLISYGPADASSSPLPLTRITVEFGDGTVNGWGGCNGFDAITYTTDGRQLNLDASRMIRSLRACKEDVGAQEEAFLNALLAADSFAVEGQQLTLDYPDGRLVFLADGVELPADPNRLTGARWNLVSYGETAVLEAAPITADFSGGQIGGVAGCNSYGGMIHVDGDTLAVGEIASTAMDCPGDDVMTQESAYLAMLIEAQSFTLEDGRLVIHTSTGDLVYRPAGDLSLEGADWLLSGIVEGEAVTATAVDAKITATFEDGRLAGFAGCNQYFADYEASDGALTLGPIGSTRKLCEEEYNQRERTFLAALGDVAGYTISRDQLTLLDGDGQARLVFTTRP